MPFCATIVAVEKRWVLHNLSVCVCSLRYPACNAHAPFCHLWPAQLYSIFPYYPINIIIFGKSYWTWNVCFDSLHNLCLEKFLILRIERDMIKMYIGLHVKCPLFLSDLKETGILTTDLRKILKIQISWESIQWEPSCSMGTYRHDNANSRFSQFCKCACKR